MKKYRLLFSALTFYSLLLIGCVMSKEVRIGNMSAPAPAIQGKADGKAQPFNFTGGDRKAALLTHPAPDVWLVFQTMAANGQPVKVELPPDAKDALISYWRGSVAARYNQDMAYLLPDVQSRRLAFLNESYNIDHVATAAEAVLDKSQITAPDGVRKLSKDEVGELITFISKSSDEIIRQAKAMPVS